MEKIDKAIALFDLDGTLCDYERVLKEDLEKLRSPFEPEIRLPIIDNSPQYLRERSDLIRRSRSWWENLPKFQLGWDILELAKELDYRIMILTQGPRNNPSALSGKGAWIAKNLPGVDFNLTRDKGLTYGRVLVDDFPGYIDRWLANRPRGQVIMPANESNADYRHPQVTRYDGSNLRQVREVMIKAKLRKSGEAITG